MNGQWSLDALYLGFDDPKYLADREKLTALCAELNAFVPQMNSMSPTEALHKALTLQEEISVTSSLLGGYAHLRSATNARDSEAVSHSGQLQAISGSIAGAKAAIEAYIASVEDLESVIASDPLLEEYRFRLESIKNDSKYLLSAREEEIMARMDISGGSAWSQQQGQLTSNVVVDYKGGKTNLSAIRNMAYEADPEVRKSAYEAELACYPKVSDAVAFSLNSIKLQVINACQLRGYESPLDQTLKQARMKRETLDALMDAMNDYLPKFWEYLKVKAKALGHKNGLPWYDLFAPMGSNSKRYTIEDARDYLLNVFSSFDSQLHDMVARRLQRTGSTFIEGWQARRCLLQRRPGPASEPYPDQLRRQL